MAGEPAAPIDGLAGDPRFPEQVVAATEEHEGLRCLWLGEDNEWIVILGHPAAEAAFALVVAVNPWFDAGDEAELRADELTYTWARRITACPRHARKQEGCQFCDAGDMTTDIWLDWQDGETKGSEPDYFPVVIWDMNA